MTTLERPTPPRSTPRADAHGQVDSPDDNGRPGAFARLARFSVRRYKGVLLAWLAIVVLAVGFAILLTV
mgnify:CR=1 FL=1